ELVFVDGENFLYENKDVLPRAFVVGESEIVEGKELLKELQEESFNPREKVLIEEGKEISGGNEFKETRIVSYEPNRVVVEAEPEKQAYLVLLDTYYNGWKAFDNGNEKEVLRANYIFRAVLLDPGKHSVEFVFKPELYESGKTISLFFLAILVLGTAFLYLKPELNKV
ncbi:MAG: YfhO family protein, partial [Candidatus Diapherotrites archaeon]|nr:YfhO family protein [Candidatus Diapherotrites archaeon]